GRCRAYARIAMKAGEVCRASIGSGMIGVAAADGRAISATANPWVLASIASRSFFLIGELPLGNLSETVVVVGNTPHDRPGVLVGHLIGNRASFLCTKAPMLRIPETNFLHGIRS